MLGNRTAQRHANNCGQFVGIGLQRSVFCQRLQNGAHIADRHFFCQQVLQHFMQRCQRNNSRHQIFGEFRHFLSHAVKQLLRFLTPKQLRRKLADHVVQVRCDNRTGLHHGEALDLRLLFEGALNPDSRQAKGRIDSLFPW